MVVGDAVEKTAQRGEHRVESRKRELRLGLDARRLDAAHV